MKRIKKDYIGFWPIIMALYFVNLSCDNPVVTDTNNDDNVPVEVVDEYYVKYEVESHSIYIASRYAQINAEKTTYSFTINSSPWETTIGPVKKGFTARIKAGYTDSKIYNSTIGAKISVSKNNGAFALKKFDLPSDNKTLVEISYVIDF